MIMQLCVTLNWKHILINFALYRMHYAFEHVCEDPSLKPNIKGYFWSFFRIVTCCSQRYVGIIENVVEDQSTLKNSKINVDYKLLGNLTLVASQNRSNFFLRSFNLMFREIFVVKRTDWWYFGRRKPKRFMCVRTSFK